MFYRVVRAHASFTSDDKHSLESDVLKRNDIVVLIKCDVINFACFAIILMRITDCKMFFQRKTSLKVFNDKKSTWYKKLS